MALQGIEIHALGNDVAAQLVGLHFLAELFVEGVHGLMLDQGELLFGLGIALVVAVTNDAAAGTQLHGFVAGHGATGLIGGVEGDNIHGWGRPTPAARRQTQKASG